MKRKAFTMIEVLLALSLLAMSAFIVSQLNLRSLFRVIRDRDEIEKIFWIKKDFCKFLFKTDQKTWPTREKPLVHTLENPEMTISSSVGEIDKKSSLKNFKNKIYIAQSEGAWKSGDVGYNIKMVSFMLKPVKEKEKK